MSQHTSPKSSPPPSVKPLNLSAINKLSLTKERSQESGKQNDPQRFLPKQLVMGSPFYQESNSSFASDIQTPLLTKFKSSLRDCINEEDENQIEESSTPHVNKSEDCVLNSRALKFSNLQQDISLTDILNYINFGPIENCDFDLTDDPIFSSSLASSSTINTNTTESNETTYRSITVSFIDSFTANKCYNQLANIIDELKTVWDSKNLSISKIKSPPLSTYIKTEISNNGASRALCLSNLVPGLPEDVILNELSYFGEISSIQYNVAKNSCFIHFNSILNAIKCFNQLPLSNSILSDSKIFYSNDRKSSTGLSDNSSSLSLVDNTFSDINDLNSLKRNNNEPYSISSTSVSSRRESTDFSNQIPKSKGKSLTSSSLKNDSIDNHDVGEKTDPNTGGNTIENESDIISHHNNRPSYSNRNDHYFNHRSNSMFEPFSNSSLSTPYPISHHPSFSSNPSFSKGYFIPDNLSTNQLILNQNNIDNRTIYLGNLAYKTTAEDICNIIRGGMLENVKIIPNRNAAFITFLSHEDAAQFIAKSSTENIIINHKYLNVGWGRNSGNLDPFIKEAVDQGASRNLYIGVNEELETADDYDLVPNDKKKQNGNDNDENNDANEEKINDKDVDLNNFKKVYKCIPDESELRRDFSIFGEIEQINYFKNGACAFINFTNILSCIKAVTDFNSETDSDYLHQSLGYKYKKLVISYGKDRCANPPKKKQIKKNKNRLHQRVRTNSHTANGGNFSYMLNESNYSVETDLAIKFDAAFEGIGISSPSAKKKSSKHRQENLDLDLDDSDVEINVEINASPRQNENHSHSMEDSVDVNGLEHGEDIKHKNQTHSNEGNFISRSSSVASFQPTPTPSHTSHYPYPPSNYSQENSYMMNPQQYYYPTTPNFLPQTPTNDYSTFSNGIHQTPVPRQPDQFVYQYAQPMYYPLNGYNKSFRGKKKHYRRPLYQSNNSSFNQSFT